MFIKAPIIAYTFDRWTGNLFADHAGGDNPLTVFNGSSSAANAFDFSGGVYGKIGGSPWTGGAMTISFNVRFDSLNSWSRVFDFGDGPDTNNILFANVGNTNTASFRIVKNGVTYALEIPNAIQVGTKQMWVITIDSTGMASVYRTIGDVNQTTLQVAVVSKQMVVPDVDQRANMYVGRSNWPSDGQFDGEIDNFYVFDYHMPQAQASRYFGQTSHVYAAAYDVWDRVQSNYLEHGFDIIDPGRNWVSGEVNLDRIGLSEQLAGSDGRDHFFPTGGADTIYAYGGDDVITVSEDWGSASVTVYGGSGTDSVYYTSRTATSSDLLLVDLVNQSQNEFYAKGDLFYDVENVYGLMHSRNYLKGNDAANFLLGGSAPDLLMGRGGDDTLWGLSGTDTIYGGPGNDHIEGGGWGDYLFGEAGNDVIHGDYGDDEIYGDADMDTLYGWNGNDRIYGGTGADTMLGGVDDDIYEVDNFGDVVTEYAGEGLADEVRTAIGSRTDSSQMYTLPANVEKLTGTSSTGQGVYANALNNIVVMGAGNDLIVLHDGGVDSVSGGDGNDFIYYGATMTAADSTDGGAGFDTVGLIGTYTLTFGASSLVGVEKLAMYSAGSAPGAVANNYTVTTVDANVAAGALLDVVGQSLLAHERLVFNGSAETNGRFNIRGGRGQDTLTGGAGNDQLWGNLGADVLRGGAGNDIFEYLAAAESTSSARDTIMDFASGDKINLIAIDPDGNAANGNGRFAWIGSSAFSGVAGELRVTGSGSIWLVEADANGDRIADLVIEVRTLGQPLDRIDFWV